ncbi:MAG: SGNH/GDSL hydrolase family protein [Gemmataceae bacterium]|nr:SGNH/GDSL hydrolase family protein [Gemmataceae bacterium]
MRHGLLRLVVLCALFITLPGRAAAGQIYLAVGDSSAFGETNRTRNPSDGDRGYVAPFADYLAGRNGGVRPTVINTAINGETTTSYFSGLVADRDSLDGITLNSRYTPFAPAYPSQHDYMLGQIAAELAAGNTIGTVTVQIGANDLSKAAGDPAFLDLDPADQQAVVAAAIGAAAANLGRLLGELRLLLPAADLFVIGYHNPYAGAPDHPLYDLAAPAVQGLNGAIAEVGGLFGATYVDFYTPVLGRERELTFIDTWRTDPLDHVHLNDAGYAVVSGQLIRAAAVPAPPGVVLASVGGLALPGRRRPARR